MFFKLAFKPRTFPFLAFLIPLTVRAMPEILMGPYIVGFDNLGYHIPGVLSWLREGVNFWGYIAEVPLFETILMQVTSWGIPLTASLKVMPPLLHGFLGLAIYFYANRVLSWSIKKSLFSALLATLYFVALRISWDLLENELGLVLLFVTLTLLHKDRKSWKWHTLLSLMMTFVVLAHPLVAVIMFVVIAVTIFRSGLQHKHNEVQSLAVISVPAALVFLLIVYANYCQSPIFSVVGDFPQRELGGWFSLFGFASYQDMVSNTLGFLLYCFLPLLPFVIIGARRLQNHQVKSWFLWSLVVIFFPIISPNAFIPGGYRWTLMFAFPAALYAAEALTHFKSNMLRLLVVSVLAVLTIGFVIMPYEATFPYYTVFPYYVPSSMLQNTVPLSDCQDTVNALQWLKANMHDGGRLLTHDAFHGWALLVLGMDQIFPYGYENPVEAAHEALQHGYDQVYLIWWTDGNGWHGQPTVPSAFNEVYRSGRIAIFIYQ